MILQSSENSERNRERDVNTLRGNTLGLLRKIHNFILFRIYNCVVQLFLDENIFFVLYYFCKSFQWYQSKPQLIMDFELLFNISMSAEIYFLYVMIDIFDILIVFIN